MLPLHRAPHSIVRYKVKRCGNATRRVFRQSLNVARSNDVLESRARVEVTTEDGQMIWYKVCLLISVRGATEVKLQERGGNGS